MEILTDILRFVEPGLKNLDPSLFQNVILGILAIFIPFAIVFLTDVLNSKKQRGEFEKMVLDKEVLGTKGVFWWSIIGIGFLAFFAGTEISTLKKISAIIFSAVILGFLSNPLWKILRFSDGQQRKFELSFLKSLNFPKFFPYKNDSRSEKMVRAWDSFWTGETAHKNQGETVYKSGEIIKIFDKHIEGAIANKKYSTAVSLAKACQHNLHKMSNLTVGYHIFPKSLKWCERYWEIAEKSEKRKKYRQIRQKILPKFLSKNLMTYDLYFELKYFHEEFFSAIIEKLLLDRGGHIAPFYFFEKYVEKKETEKKIHHVESLLRTFCKGFFKNMENDLDDFLIWLEGFPKHWEITAENSKMDAPKIILSEFLTWARPRIASDRSAGDDEGLVKVASIIFPCVDETLFKYFLILHSSSDIESAIKSKTNFYITNRGFYFPRRDDGNLEQMINKEEQDTREEAVNVIFKYFDSSFLERKQRWEPVMVYKEDLSNRVIQNWGQYSSERKKTILANVKKTKLQKLLDELNGKKIKDLCRKSKNYQANRYNLKELIELLIKKAS